MEDYADLVEPIMLLLQAPTLAALKMQCDPFKFEVRMPELRRLQLLRAANEYWISLLLDDLAERSPLIEKLNIDLVHDSLIDSLPRLASLRRLIVLDRRGGYDTQVETNAGRLLALLTPAPDTCGDIPGEDAIVAFARQRLGSPVKRVEVEYRAVMPRSTPGILAEFADRSLIISIINPLPPPRTPDNPWTGLDE
ncbi:hypothetical protein FB451DRAFT_1407581 [Mycena latifolia]|nr:hypothetical protein FB451DRAFT_1407581 [Mycena latifolia]